MKNVIFVSTLPLWSLGKGQGGPAFTQTVKKYIDEGWNVYLVSDEPANNGYPALDESHNICLKPSVFKQYDHIRKLGLLFRWLDHKVMTRRFVKTIKKILAAGSAETVLYAYEIFGVESCRRLAEKYNIPFVTRFQGTCYITPLADTLINRIRRYPNFQALSQQSNLVIMTNDGTCGKQLLERLHNPTPILFLRNGLELMELDLKELKKNFDKEAFRKQLGVEQNETMFVSVSRLGGMKRVERIVDGFADFCQHSATGKLVIVGDGETPQPREELMKRAKSLGIFERVIFVGAVPHSQVYYYMMAADIFVSLYDYSNVGNPLLEAMTLGKCIITLDVGDTKSLIHDRKNGILLTMDTLPVLGTVMHELSENAALRNQLGNAAAQYAQENFCSWEERMNVEFKAVSDLTRE